MSAVALFGAAPETPCDPYPNYAALRARDPVHRDERLGAWVLTRHCDVDASLRDPRFGVTRLDGPRKTGVLSVFRRDLFLFKDPPDHARLRALARSTFHPRRMRQLRPRIEEIAGELLDALEPGSSVDLVSAYAYALPVRVIAELLGLPIERLPRLRALSDSLARYLVGIDHPEEERAGAEAGLQELRSLFAEVLAERRLAPKQDGLSALAAAQMRGELSERELHGSALLLFLAGHETTASWIANGLGTLLTHPEAMDSLRRAPERIASASEELLRFETPIQATQRIAHQSCELGGRRIPRGDSVVAVLAAANRDPAVFSAPDRLNLGRRPNRHLSFGAGAHVCLGAPLARLEAQVAIGTYVKRFPRSQGVPGGLRWKPSTNLRGLDSLFVQLR